MCCWTKESSSETETQPAPRRQGPDRIFDRRGTWVHNPAVVSTGARSPGLGPNQQSPSAEESSVKNMMASMAWVADNPIHGQGDADEHSKKMNSGNNSRRNSLSESLKKLKSRSNSLSGSLKKATNKLFGRGHMSTLESYFQQPSHGMPLHGMQPRSGSGQTPGSAAPQGSMHEPQPQASHWEVPADIHQQSAPGQQPQSGMFHYPPTQYRQENDVYAPQQQNISPYQTSIDSVLAHAQNTMPCANEHGAPTHQPSQGSNDPYNRPASNVAPMQTQYGQGPYQAGPPNGQQASTPQLQHALQFRPIQPAPTALNSTSDIASKAGCLQHLKSITHVVGTQGRRGLLPTSAGFSEPSLASTIKPSPLSDGRFHCPSCPQTYKHAKDLERHGLRHVGARPYSCVLCGCTFGRPDTTKKHYRKCAMRRGIAVGPRDHLQSRKQQGSLAYTTPQTGDQVTAPEPAHGQMGDLTSSNMTAYQQRTLEPGNGYTFPSNQSSSYHT